MNKVLMTAAVATALTCGAALAQGTLKATVQDAPQSQAPSTAAPQASPATQGQSPAAGQAQPSSTPRIAPGSVIPVQLTKTIDAKKVKTGDEVVAKVTQDMKTQSGEVLVPKDTKVIGHVTEAQARNKEQKQSELAISFDQAVMNGNSVQLPMSIQAIIGEQNNNNVNSGGAPAGSDTGAAPNSGAGMPAGGGASHGGAMAGSTPPPTASPSTQTGGTPPPESQSGNNPRPVINAQTQGVIGISNMTLAPAKGNQGSLMTSEKNNVKLESGTMLLLKVKQ